MKLSSRTSATGFTLLGLTALLGALLAVTAAGCEAVLGTSDLHDQGAGDDAGPIGDDDDGDDDGAAPTDGGTDGSHVVLDATAKEGGARDAGDAGEAGDAGDASDGAMGKEAGGGEGGAADGGPVSGASCRNNPSAMQCGADTSASCCGSDAVPGDFYFRTYDDFGDDFDEITVNGFVLDSFEVTVGRMRAYAAYLAAGGALPTVGAGKHGHLNGGKRRAGEAGRHDHVRIGVAARVQQPRHPGRQRQHDLRQPAELRHHLHGRGGQHRQPARELRELVRRVRVLHLGRRLSPHRGRMGAGRVRRRRGERLSVGRHARSELAHRHLRLRGRIRHLPERRRRGLPRQHARPTSGT